MQPQPALVQSRDGVSGLLGGAMRGGVVLGRPMGGQMGEGRLTLSAGQRELAQVLSRVKDGVKPDTVRWWELVEC